MWAPNQKKIMFKDENRNVLGELICELIGAVIHICLTFQLYFVFKKLTRTELRAERILYAVHYN